MNYLLTLVLLVVVENSLGQQGSSCVTPNRRNGICTQLRLCRPLFRLVERRPIPANVSTFLRASQCGYTGNEPDVCCPVSNTNNRATLDPQKLRLLPNLTTCGFVNNNKIVGGTETLLDEFPWMVLLEYTKPVGSGFYCGGVIINNRYVLTAAHCIANPDIPSNWRVTSVRLGEHDTKTNPDCSEDVGCNDEHVDIPVESMKYHELYDGNQRAQPNDIALLRLATPIVFTDYIQPICLPLLNKDLLENNFISYTPYAAGWGKTEKDSQSDVKLKVRVPVVTLESCAVNYRGMGLTLVSKQLCAGGEKGKDTCRGDSGGPLMIEHVQNNRGNWYTIGIASFGPSPCGLEGWAGVYTKVGDFSDWILRNIEP